MSDTPESVRGMVNWLVYEPGNTNEVEEMLERYATLLGAIAVTMPPQDQEPSGMAMMMANGPTIGEVINALKARVAELEAKLSGVAQWVRYPGSER